MFRTIKLLPTLAILALVGFAASETTKAAPVFVASRAVLCPGGTAPPCNNNIDFQGTPTNTSQPQPFPPITLLGVTFAVPAGRMNAGPEIIDGFNVGASGTQVLTVAGDVIGVLGGMNNLQITLPTGITTVGFDIKSGNTSAGSQTGGSYEIYENGTGPTNLVATIVIPTYTAFGFFGVTDTAGISSIFIRAISGGEPVIDNFTFGPAQQAAPTAEPASMILLGTGLVGLMSAIRKRRKATMAQASRQAALAQVSQSAVAVL